MKPSVESSYRLLQLMFDNSSELVIAQDSIQQTIFTNQAYRDFWGTEKSHPGLNVIVNARETASNSLEQIIPTCCSANQNSLVSVENAAGEVRALRLKRKQLTLENGASYRVGIYTDFTAFTEIETLLVEERAKHAAKNSAMEALNSVAVELMERLDLPVLLQRAVNNAAKITGATYSYVAMVHESGEYLEVAAASGGPQELVSATLKCGEGLSGEVWRTAKTVVINDYLNHPLRMPGRDFVRQAGAIPIKISNEVVGVLGVIYTGTAPEIESQMETLEKFAQLVAVAVENTKLHESTKTELSRTEAINDLNWAIHSSTDFRRLLDRVCTKLVSAFRASKAHIYRYEDGPGLTPLVAWEQHGDKILHAEQGDSTTVSGSIATWCIQNQETAFLKRGVDDPRESIEVHQLRHAMRLGSTVCIPLVHKNIPWGVLYVHRRCDQSDFTNTDINLFKIIGGQTSIALHRHDLLQQLQTQTYGDSLTGLPNRLQFDKSLSEALNPKPAVPVRLAVLYLDLDGLKSVNESYGHSAGDEILRNVALRLKSCLKPQDILARMGSDEFAVIIADYETRANVIAIGERLSESVGRVYHIRDVRIQISISVGINFYPYDAGNSSELLKNADIAVYSAKNRGSGLVTVFSQIDADLYKHHLSMEQDLRTALSKQQFRLHYQPKVSCREETCSSVEALLRWHHPEKGIIAPADFISVAEDSGLIQQIGTWVLDGACRQGAQFLKAGRRISVSVNISERQFNMADFVETVFSTVEKHGFLPELLELEVTESVVMHNVEIVVERLAELRQAGIRIAIDDFGTGYSSLKHLEDLPVDVLKIDKAFVDKLEHTTAAKSLVNTIILMARSLNLTTVAEGVETEEQRGIIRLLGCDYVQGFLYSKPLPATELSVMLSQMNEQASV